MKELDQLNDEKSTLTKNEVGTITGGPFPGGDEGLAAMVRTHDWSATALGPIEDWSKELVTTASLVLSSPFPAVLFWGPDFLMIYNDPYCSFLAEKHPSSLGTSARKVWGEAWDIMGPEVEAAIAQGTPTYKESTLVPILKDGALQPFYWDHWFVPVFQDGSIVGIYSTAHNTTEAVTIARERDAIASQLEQVMTATTDGVAYLDRQWRITYLNDRAKQIIAPSGNVLGTNHWDSYPDTIFEGSPYVEHYYRAMDEKIAGTFEAFYPAPLNVWFQANVQPATNGIVIFFRDITEQRRAEEHLRESRESAIRSEAQLQLITDSLPAFISYLDTEYRYLRVNRTYENWYGLPSSQILGRTVEEVLGQQAAEQVRERLVKVFEGEAQHFEYRLVIAGQERVLSVSQIPDFDPEGKVQGVVVQGHDVTEQKVAQEALIQSEKLAAVGKLASSIAHEINNPLESVTNLLYLARSQDSTPSECDEYLEAAERELRRVSMITTQTLRFHKQSTRPTAVSPSDLLAGSLAVYHGRLANSQVQVLQRERTTHKVHCLDGEIRQVINNLVGNAIDAMATGGRLLLRSRAGRQYKTGQTGIVITVADTGSGIPVAIQQKIFDPFFTTKGLGGTGLGLWISQEIVARHRGQLSVRSSQRQGSSGTVFRLFLPFEGQ